jgi:hypothetical protein
VTVTAELHPQIFNPPKNPAYEYYVSPLGEVLLQFFRRRNDTVHGYCTRNPALVAQTVVLKVIRGRKARQVAPTDMFPSDAYGRSRSHHAACRSLPMDQLIVTPLERSSYSRGIVTRELVRLRAS